MTQSPIEQLLQAIDGLDVEAIAALFAPEARVLVVDGRRAEGIQAMRQLMTAFLGQLRATTHRITGQWHEDDVWIAEVEADYELKDWLQLNRLPRAFLARAGAEGITDLRVYGAHEHQLSDHRTGEEGMWIGTRWVPPL